MTRISKSAENVVRQWISNTLELEGVSGEPGTRPGEYVVILPGERKLKTTVSILVGDRSVSLSAFVIRHPDENAEEFWRWMLRRNAKLAGVAFAIDGDGDVYLRARLPVGGITEESLDEVAGLMLSTADESFNELLVIGFITSMRREWRWRISRGESTRNLEAFRHLLEGCENDPEES